MKRHHAVVAALGLALGLLAATSPPRQAAAAQSSPASAPPPGASVQPPPPWQSAVGRDHSLAGRIWDVAARRFIDPPALAGRVALARFVLLGERHDNQDHHQLQAWVVAALASAGRRPAVAFEMLTLDQAPALARHIAASPRDAAGLGPAVAWEKSGWPEWKSYQPIAEAALDAGLRIVPANLPPASVQAMRREGTAGLDSAFVARHGLDRALADGIRAALANDIKDSHCGQAPDAAVQKMIAVQRARDAQMAESLLDASEPDGAVLIAGSGHVRTDWGVPVYLRARAQAVSIASVTFMEVTRGKTAVTDYAEPDGRLPYDYVWFTPRVDEDDPCEKFRKSLEKLRERR